MTRSRIRRELFSGGIPTLWCPAITHFTGPATPDDKRIATHLEVLSKNVAGLLIPGSTGEGWDMSDEEILGLLETVLRTTSKTGQVVLIGVLKTTAEQMVTSIEKTVQWLMQHTKERKWQGAFAATSVAGFVICPPAGEELPQEEIRAGLSSVLALGYPTALYQLPQVTRNEMTPDTVAEMAEKHENFFLFKDTSGKDRVAASGKIAEKIFLVRGAEGGYADWPKAGGGVYDGLLLSTGNSFPGELATVLRRLEAGDRQGAADLSLRVEKAVDTVMRAMGAFPEANAFATTNKIFDHVRAWGTNCLEHDPPMVYNGARIPVSAIQLGLEALQSNGFDVDRGYLS